MRARTCNGVQGGLIRVSLERRRALKWLTVHAGALALPGLAWAQAGRIASARVWPAQEYTRLVIEAATPIPYQLRRIAKSGTARARPRGRRAGRDLAKLPARVHANDPYIVAVRVREKDRGSVRVVLDLRSEVRPQLFPLPPVAEFGHRLVLDLYPVEPLDPLMALIAEQEKREAAAPRGFDSPALAEAPAPAIARPQVVASDHRGDRSGPRRRGPGRDRPTRHLREARRARDRAAAEEADRPRDRTCGRC